MPLAVAYYTQNTQKETNGI